MAHQLSSLQAYTPSFRSGWTTEICDSWQVR